MINKRYKSSFLLPAVLVYGLFFFIPSFISFYFAFTDWDMSTGGAIHFIGLDNFKLLWNNDDFSTALYNTILFTIVTTGFKILFGLILALILNEALKTKNLLRTVFFFPSMMSMIVVGLVFTSVFQLDGILNHFMQAVGLKFMTIDWLGSRTYAIWSVIVVEIWKWSGFCMVIFLAGMQSVPKDYLEAATIDGASYLAKLRYITIPLIMPSITVNVIINIIGGLKVFEIVYVMTNGGPGNSSQVLTGIVFDKFGNGLYGIGTAANLVLLIFVAIVIIPSISVLRRKEVSL